MFKFVQIAGPQIDLRAFVEIVGQAKVTEVDSYRIEPVAKFADLTTECFDNRFHAGYEHLYLSFFYVLPLELDGHLRDYVGMIVTGEPAGMTVRGIMSGSFVDWAHFLKWATSEDRELSVRKLGNYLFDTFFRQYSFFAGRPRTNLSDSTFMLT